MKSKIVQIAIHAPFIIALCEDGSIHRRSIDDAHPTWTEVCPAHAE